MSDFLIVSASILLVDVVNLVLFAAVILTLSGAQPVTRSVALILGHSIAYYVVGLLVIFGLAKILSPVIDFFSEGFSNPKPIHFTTGMILGLLLIAIAVRSFFGNASADGKRVQKTDAETSVLSAFFLGVTIMFVGAPFAIPYFGFINELYRFEVGHKPLVLLIYNLVYALPFALLPFAYSLWGEGAVGTMKVINAFLNDTMSWLVPLLFLLLGFAFAADAAKFFLTGSGLV